MRYLAVRDGGDVVAAAVLKIDGATAGLDAVGTDPAHRGRGHGDALVTEALALAAAAGCDVVGPRRQPRRLAPPLVRPPRLRRDEPQLVRR